MNAHSSLKPVVSLFIAVGFCVLAVTGVLFLFHVKNGVLMMMHQWLGLSFAIAGTLHVMLNLTPLLSYFRLRKGLAALAAALVLAGVLGVIGIYHKGPPRPQERNGQTQPEQHAASGVNR